MALNPTQKLIFKDFIRMASLDMNEKVSLSINGMHNEMKLKITISDRWDTHTRTHNLQHAFSRDPFSPLTAIYYFAVPPPRISSGQISETEMRFHQIAKRLSDISAVLILNEDWKSKTIVETEKLLLSKNFSSLRKPKISSTL